MKLLSNSEILRISKSVECKLQKNIFAAVINHLVVVQISFELFFRPDIKICKAGKVIFGQDKFCSLIIVKSCGWLLENCKRVQQCVNVLLYDLKGRKKMMMKFLCSLLLLFKMWKRSLILSISHFSYPAINLQMSSQSRSRSKAMNNKIEKVVQSKMNLRWWWSKICRKSFENGK